MIEEIIDTDNADRAVAEVEASDEEMIEISKEIIPVRDVIILKIV